MSALTLLSLKTVFRRASKETEPYDFLNQLEFGTRNDENFTRVLSSGSAGPSEINSSSLCLSVLAPMDNSVSVAAEGHSSTGNLVGDLPQDKNEPSNWFRGFHPLTDCFSGGGDTVAPSKVNDVKNVNHGLTCGVRNVNINLDHGPFDSELETLPLPD